MTTIAPTRLSVNISQDTLGALLEVATDRGISMTESLRRLVGYGILVYQVDRDGGDALLRQNGRLERIVLCD